MMSTFLLSIELAVFVISLVTLFQLRKFGFTSLFWVEGLFTYVAPTEADFEVLQKSDKKVKTNMKGEPKKHQKSLAKQTQAKFPMRTIPVGQSLLQYLTEFYEIYDMLFMMFICTFNMVLVTSLMRISPYQPFEGLVSQKLTFTALLLQFTVWLSQLCKDTFSTGWFRYKDEVKF